MTTPPSIKNRKVIMLCLQFMRMVNEDGPAPVFANIELNEEDNEISFTANSSHSVALELTMSLCFLFSLTIYPYAENGKVKYTLLGN